METRRHPYLAPNHAGRFISFAHRGGTSDRPENTLAAFAHAHALGYRYLETDVHLTADGVLVAFHDDDLRRTCGRDARISELPWSEVAAARVDGREPIPLLTDLLDAFPDAFFNIDAKSDESVDPLVEVLRARSDLDRVCIGSFSHRRLLRVRDALGATVCTSASPREVAQWMAGVVPSGPDCFQVPVRQGALPVVTAASVARARRRSRPVHVWTIDDPGEIQRLIDLGVDGIMTDDTPTLRRIAEANDKWSHA